MSFYQISQSSLLSLKAEILRKQQEVAKAKGENEVKREIIKKNTPLELKNKGVEDRKKFDEVEEDQDVLKLSRTVLEHKSQLYEKLSSGKLSPSETHKRFLVQFDKKSGNDPPTDNPEDEPDRYPESEDEVDDHYSSDENGDPAEKWVKYTDCLGRTRKCMAKDLEHIKRNDEELRKTVEEKRRQSGEEKPEILEKPEIHHEPEELMSNEMKNEILRKQWEKDEERLRNKSDIHYQDVLFGEARTHGVGYYSFSTHEEERFKQQEALRKLRQETEEKQKKAQHLKEMRDKQLAARIKAARDRKRARLGLPPEEDEPEPPKPQTSDAEKEKLEEQKIQEQKEKMLEEARKKHVRPWDIGKEGVKVHYERTQEEWVEEKRTERVQEFAPPAMYHKDRKETEKQKYRAKQKSEGQGREQHRLDVSTRNAYESNEQNKPEGSEKQNGLYFTTKGRHKHQKKFDGVQEIDETPESYNLINVSNKPDIKLNRRPYSSNFADECDHATPVKLPRGVEIPPPPTFEYYGPSSSSRDTTKQNKVGLEESIEAGLKFLRRQVEQKEQKREDPRDMFLL